MSTNRCRLLGFPASKFLQQITPRDMEPIYITKTLNEHFYVASAGSLLCPTMLVCFSYLRQSTPIYVHLRLSTPIYADLRLSTPAYLHLSTLIYAYLRSSTLIYAYLRLSTPIYAYVDKRRET